MIWSNWIYLAIGIGLGVGSRWLFGQSKEKKDSYTTAPPVTSGVFAPNEKPYSQDVSVLEQLQQTQIAYQLAQQTSQFKSGFLARTSHELRSPLNSLIGLHQLILSDLCDDPAEEREFVAQANQSALKLVSLMDQILEVSRLEHGNNQLEIQPLQLTTVLSEVYNLTHLLAANRNLRFQLSPPDPETYVLADPHWLRQVLLNLLDICFIQMEEGSIFVSTQSTPAQQSAQIWLDVQMPSHTMSEPVNLNQSEHLPKESVLKNIAPSPGMTLLLTQTLLELMHSRLEILPVPTAEATDSFTRIQLTIPLMIQEF